jgi:uncharacterized protein
LHIERSGDYILVNGEVSTKVQLECSRCLDAIEILISAPIESTLTSAEFIENKESKELKGEDLDLVTYEGDEFSVDDIVAEPILLMLPLKPLCREECKGLCPQCGKNRNREACTCGSTVADNPFSILNKLKIDR